MAEVLAEAMFIATTLWSFKVPATTKKYAVSFLSTPFKCFVAGPLKRAGRFLQTKLSQETSLNLHLTLASRALLRKCCYSEAVLNSILFYLA